MQPSKEKYLVSDKLLLQAKLLLSSLLKSLLVSLGLTLQEMISDLGKERLEGRGRVYKMGFMFCPRHITYDP